MTQAELIRLAVAHGERAASQSLIRSVSLGAIISTLEEETGTEIMDDLLMMTLHGAWLEGWDAWTRSRWRQLEAEKAAFQGEVPDGA